MDSLLKKYSVETVEKARKVKAVISDVDGVLTDGKIIYSSSGEEIKMFNVKDGLIIKKLREAGLIVGLITGRKSPVVERRAGELQLDFCYQAAGNKTEFFEQVLDKHGLKDDEISYLGDDINDLKLIQRAGLGVSPADAPQYIRDYSDLVSEKSGGEGVLREVADLILAARGQLEQFLK